MIFRKSFFVICILATSYGSAYAASKKKPIKAVPMKIQEPVSLGYLSRSEVRRIWAEGLGVHCLENDFIKLPANEAYINKCVSEDRANPPRFGNYLHYSQDPLLPDVCRSQTFELATELSVCVASVWLKTYWSQGKQNQKTARIYQILEWTADIPKPSSFDAVMYLRSRGELLKKAEGDTK
jgi:hypothetical protein